MAVTVRRANESDAIAACEAVRRSITELCTSDHQNDPAILAGWLKNKTTDLFKRFIGDETKSCVVAIIDDRVCGFGQINRSGEVGLLYTAPEMRFRGASTAMLKWLEGEALRWGLTSVSLKSTQTARRFYETRGYALEGGPVPGVGVLGSWPMVKSLAP